MSFFQVKFLLLPIHFANRLKIYISYYAIHSSHPFQTFSCIRHVLEFVKISSSKILTYSFSHFSSRPSRIVQTCLINRAFLFERVIQLQFGQFRRRRTERISLSTALLFIDLCRSLFLTLNLCRFPDF
jgi:hypothetical protein